MRPHRKRRREIILGGDEDYIPFEDDLVEPHGVASQGQVPFLDLQTEDFPSTAAPSGVAAIPEVEALAGEPGTADPATNDDPADAEILDDDVPSPSTPGVEEDQHVHPIEQPEAELTPLPSSSAGIPPMTQLTAALRRSPDKLDGLHASMQVSIQELQELEGPATEGAVSSKRDAAFAFMVSRGQKKFKKKVQKTGAGREVSYEKAEPEIQKMLQETRMKEWSNWEKFTNGRWIDESELQELLSHDATAKVIPTRWVDVDKSEPGDPPTLKSRLVVRGDLEDPNFMRTDAPTASQLALSMVFIYAACEDTSLFGGDISAAFLQGSTLDRVLILSMPRGGIPGQEAGRYYVVSTTVYGTRDAPRGWYKRLDKTIKDNGLKELPYEPAAYSLQDEAGNVLGLVAMHVDDLIWTGQPLMETIMDKVCSEFRFGKLQKDNFKYCGRNIVRDQKGIHIICSSLIDRVKPIFLTREQRLQKTERVPEYIKSQMRSIIGSLAWLGRVCRPDLSYAICKMQSSVHEATFDDACFTNSIVNIAMKTKNEGITYPRRAFPFNELSIISIHDASHAADYDVNTAGQKLGFRSQSGRLLCLGHSSFPSTLCGPLMLVDWHSTTIKRVCRSTLQSETLSLLSGSEDADHLRYVLYGMKVPSGYGNNDWLIAAQDDLVVLWMTDCRSLSDHLVQPGLSVVQDKRLAIDLCGLRQSIWRHPGELHGNPILTDRVPSDGTTKVTWTTTDRMLADPLTKQMKPKALLSLMHGCWMDLTPTKHSGCEITLQTT